VDTTVTTFGDWAETSCSRAWMMCARLGAVGRGVDGAVRVGVPQGALAFGATHSSNWLVFLRVVTGLSQQASPNETHAGSWIKLG